VETKKNLGVIIAVVFVLFLLPMLYIARYMHPSADDFSYGAATRAVWLETGSLVQTLSRAVTSTQSWYNGWQGTFSAIFLMTLHPAVFSVGMYMLGAWLVMLGFVASMFFFMKIVLADYLGAEKRDYLIIASVVTFVSLHFIPSPVEGLFWYNAAMFYTGFHALALLMVSLLLIWIKADTTRPFICIAVPLLAFFIGGGNYVTALVTFVVLGLFAFYCIVIKKSRWQLPVVGLLAISIALIISAVAPGNALRQVNFEPMHPLRAIIMSFYYGAGIVWIRFLFVPFWFAFAALIPVVYRVVRGSVFSYKYPWLVIPLMFGVYASTFTPNLYSWSTFGPLRVLNVNFFVLLLFVFFSMVYALGYIARRDINFGGLARYKNIFVIACACLFIAGSIIFTVRDVNTMAGVSATHSLITGEARTFHNENNVRLEAIQIAQGEGLILAPFTVTPHVLFFEDITDNVTDWRNLAFASFFGLEAVLLRR